MPNTPLAERILNFIQAKGYEPRRLQELGEAMGLGEDEQGDFHDACKALMHSGRMVLGTRNTVSIPDPPRRVAGSFRANPKGFGFLIPDAPRIHGDLYVPANATKGAMTGDRVAAEVRKKGKREGKMLFEAHVTEILQRGQSRFVGNLQLQAGRWYIIPDGSTMHAPILIDDPGAKRVKVGDQVVVEVVKFPTERSPARGVIVKALGPAGEPGVDALSIIEQFQLPGEFPEAALSQAREMVASFNPEKAAEGRLDLRDLTIITIDPTDAKDFDDAISLSHNHGIWELGVHIADVAHFVPEGGPLDQEARERANSVYLPDMVIPMLPEVLSNGVCSLQEGEPRLTKSTFITFDQNGTVKKTAFANSVIHSTKRLTYEQASAALDGKPGRIGAKVLGLLGDMEKLARIIQRRRLKHGMLTLHLPDNELVFDDVGRTIDVVPEDTSFSHTIIEMFMVEANEAVARHLFQKDIRSLRRIHEASTKLQDGSLRRLVKFLGHELPGHATHRDLQNLLDAVKGKDEAFAINLAVLRSMEQAEYSPSHIGHFALASEHYCHFTSPIRRYPDLTVHRLLDDLLDDGKEPEAIVQASTEADLEGLGAHCSGNERRAEAAERELKLVYMLRFLEKQIGEHYGGVVTGIAQVGLFIQLDRFLVEGLVRFDRLGNDWWEVDPDRAWAIGQRTGRKIRIGDRLTVSTSRIDIPHRQLDLQVVEFPVRMNEPRPMGKTRSSSGKKNPRRKSTTGNRPTRHVTKRGKPRGRRSTRG